MFSLLTRVAPIGMIGLLVLPVLAGLIGTVLPAFGYLPAAGLDHASLAPFIALAATPGIGCATLLSLGTGLVATALSVMIAFATVALFIDHPVLGLIRRLLSPLLAVPHAAAAFGLAALIAPSGLLVRAASPWLTGWERPPDLLIVNDTWGLTLIAGLVAKETPFLLLMILAALPQTHGSHRLLAAQSLGYGRLKAFAVAVAPLVYPQVRLAVMAVLVYGASNIEMAMLLGPTSPPTLSVLALRANADPDLGHRTVAAAAAILQLGVCILAVAIWWLIERLFAVALAQVATSGHRAKRDGLARGITAIAALYPTLAIAGGLVTLALWSLAGPWRFPMLVPETFTMATWMRTLPALSEPLGWTLALGLGSTLIAVILALLSLEREDETGRQPRTGALLILYAPLLVPQIAFVFGLSSLAVATRTDGTFISVLIVHLAFVLPYVYLSLAGPWRAFDSRYALAAQALGANRARVFLAVRVPMLLRAIATALALGFAVSVAQYLPTLLVGAGHIASITTEAVSLSAGQDRRVIGAVALVQAALPAISFALALGLPAFLFRHRRGMAAGERA